MWSGSSTWAERSAAYGARLTGDPRHRPPVIVGRRPTGDSENLSRNSTPLCAGVLCLEAAELALCARRRPSRPATCALLPRTSLDRPFLESVDARLRPTEQ